VTPSSVLASCRPPRQQFCLRHFCGDVWGQFGVLEAAFRLCLLPPAVHLLVYPPAQVSRRTKRSFLPWFITHILVAAAWFKLFTLASELNKMAFQVRTTSTQGQAVQNLPLLQQQDR